MKEGSLLLESIGWIATAAFASSYFWKSPDALRRVQALAALLWVVYGVMIHAMPVVAANVIVAAVAIWSSWRRQPKNEQPAGPVLRQQV